MDQPRTNTGEVTLLLTRARAGDAQATDKLLPLVYEELRTLAARHLAGERADHTLQPTALVHEAYLRLVGPGDVSWENRAHFFGAAAKAIRRILIDHARAKGRAKRDGGGERVELEGLGVASPVDGIDLEALDEALTKLGTLDPQKVSVVELRFFGGLTGLETAQALGISESTVAREWQFARAWLHREVSKGDTR